MTLKVPIEFDGKSNASVNKSFDEVAKRASTLSEKLTAVSTAYLALDKLFEKAKETFRVLVDSVLEYEKANTKLKTTLEVMGLSIDKNFESVRNFSEQMQSLAGIQDEVITTITATNIALGLNVQQAESMTQAAIGLSKAQGVDLVTANNELIQSLNGQVRGLRDVSKEVSAFNKVQLAQGAAIELIGQKFNKFITADVSTAGGALERIKISFEELIKTVGIAFFEGLDIPGHMVEIIQYLEDFGHYLTTNRAVIVEFGTYISSSFIPSLKIMSAVFGGIIDVVNAVSHAITGMMTLALYPFEQAANRLVKLYSVIKGDKTLGGIADTDWANKNANLQAHSLASGAFDNTASVPVPMRQLQQSTTATNKSFGKANLPLSRELIDEQRNFQKQLNSEILNISNIGSNQLIAEYLDRANKLNQIEKDAAQKEFDLAKEVEAAKENLDEKYRIKFHDQYLQQRIDAAQASGETIRVIELQYKQEIEMLGKKLKNQEIMQEEYTKSVKEAQRKASSASMQTSGSASTDDLLNKTTAVVSSISGGLNSIIGTVGQMFGPYGTLIAGIIQLLNISKEEFAAMTDGIIKAAAQLPKNIADNIPEIIRSIPESLASTIAFSFDINFWTGVVKGLWQALKDMFHNFWALLFGGDLITSATKAKEHPVFKGFGSDDPNSGDGKFKIKDVDLANRRRAGNFEDTFKDTVEEAQKGFTYYLKQAWDEIIKMLGKFFSELPELLISGLTGIQDKLQLFKGWGGKIIEGFLEKIPVIGPLLGKLGGNIWDTFIESINTKIEALKDILGGNIWEGLKKFMGSDLEFIKGIGGSIWIGFTDLVKLQATEILAIGKYIWNGFVASTLASVAILTNMGKIIWNGLQEAIKGAASGFKDIGKLIVQGFIDGLKSAADAIKNFFKSLVPGGGGGDGGGGLLGSIIKTASPMFAAAGGPVIQSMSNPGLASAFSSAGALHFANGGMVPGAGLRDSVPSVLTPGERVLTEKQQKNMGNTTVVNFSFNVAAGAIFDKDAVKKAMPQIIDIIRRESRNGIQVVHPSGVYS